MFHSKKEKQALIIDFSVEDELFIVFVTKI